MVGWIAWPADRVSISGETARYHSSQHGTREFCGACGTALLKVTGRAWMPVAEKGASGGNGCGAGPAPHAGGPRATGVVVVDFAEQLAAPEESSDGVITYSTLYSGLRRYDAKVPHASGTTDALSLS